jgi:DNA-binding NtrC family response regulator
MEQTLLVFDDDRLTLRSLGRVLRGIFDQTLLVQNARQAEEMLSAHTVTHLLCDRRLAEQQTGDKFIQQWKERWPTIRYAALMTGDDVSPYRDIPQIDAVFNKPLDPSELRAALIASQEAFRDHRMK